MCDLWRDEIPSDLQRDFERQIDERVNSAIMDQVASSIGTSAINEEALETELREKFILEYLEMFRTGRWPPQVTTIQDTVTKSTVSHWFCFRCDEKNSDSFTTCRNCLSFREDISENTSPDEIDSWPPRHLVPDVSERAELREKLLKELAFELESENPLSDTVISEEEFRTAVDRLKRSLLVVS
jgi:hypothetical protein